MNKIYRLVNGSEEIEKEIITDELSLSIIHLCAIQKYYDSTKTLDYNVRSMAKKFLLFEGEKYPPENVTRSRVHIITKFFKDKPNTCDIFGVNITSLISEYRISHPSDYYLYFVFKFIKEKNKTYYNIAKLSKELIHSFKIKNGELSLFLYYLDKTFNLGTHLYIHRMIKAHCERIDYIKSKMKKYIVFPSEVERVVEFHEQKIKDLLSQEEFFIFQNVLRKYLNEKADKYIRTISDTLISMIKLNNVNTKKNLSKNDKLLVNGFENIDDCLCSCDRDYMKICACIPNISIYIEALINTLMDEYQLNTPEKSTGKIKRQTSVKEIIETLKKSQNELKLSFNMFIKQFAEECLYDFMVNNYNTINILLQSDTGHCCNKSDFIRDLIFKNPEKSSLVHSIFKECNCESFAKNYIDGNPNEGLPLLFSSAICGIEPIEEELYIDFDCIKNSQRDRKVSHIASQFFSVVSESTESRLHEAIKGTF